jgi:hypothetical protein
MNPPLDGQRSPKRRLKADLRQLIEDADVYGKVARICQLSLKARTAPELLPINLSTCPLEETMLQQVISVYRLAYETLSQRDEMAKVLVK